MVGGGRGRAIKHLAVSPVIPASAGSLRLWAGCGRTGRLEIYATSAPTSVEAFVCKVAALQCTTSCLSLRQPCRSMPARKRDRLLKADKGRGPFLEARL